MFSSATVVIDIADKIISAPFVTLIYIILNLHVSEITRI